MLVDLDTLKMHLRVLHSHQDNLITAYAAAAERRVSDYIDRPIYPTEDEIPQRDDPRYDAYAISVVPEVVTSIMLLVELSWTGRDGEGMPDNVIGLPRPVAQMLSGLRVWRSEPNEGTYCREAPAP